MDVFIPESGQVQIAQRSARGADETRTALRERLQDDPQGALGVSAAKSIRIKYVTEFLDVARELNVDQISMNRNPAQNGH